MYFNYYHIVFRHNTQHYTNQLSKDTNQYIKEINYIQQSDNSSDQVFFLNLKFFLYSNFKLIIFIIRNKDVC